MKYKNILGCILFFLSILLVLASIIVTNKLQETIFESLSVFWALGSIGLLSINIPEEKAKVK
jgi:hypothetical protein